MSDGLDPSDGAYGREAPYRSSRLAHVRDAGEAATKKALVICAVASIAVIVVLPAINGLIPSNAGFSIPTPDPWVAGAALMAPAFVMMAVWGFMAGRIDALPERRAFAIAHAMWAPGVVVGGAGLVFVWVPL